MSFAERHKTWLLPALGVGVVAVIYFNFRSGSQPYTPPAAPPPAPAVTPAPPLESPPPVEPVGAFASNLALWDDLKPLAIVPQSLALSPTLEAGATAVLGEGMLHPPPPAPARYAVPAEPLPMLAKAPKPEAGTGLQEGPAPDPEFLIEGPEGRRAWFAGAAYRERQKLDGEPFTVERIGRSQVVLTGPKGTKIRSTHPVFRPEVP